ncbi:MAG: hypothetical protein ACK5H1_05145 [Tenacibaculum sp.]
MSVFLSTYAEVNSQCAMCKAVVEGSSETMAKGVNNGISYLMIFPYLLVAALLYIIYKYNKKTQS